MSSYFKKVYVGLAALIAFMSHSSAYAININAIYVSSCERELGIVIHVDEEKLQILTLEGVIKSISRYEIIYFAYYPIGAVPIHSIKNADASKVIKVKTLYENKVVDLVSGWAVDFSKKEIAFLTLTGEETVITRDSIWDIEFVDSNPIVEIPGKPDYNLDFAHPYPFSHCGKAVPEDKTDTRVIYPQQLLGDPLFIKNELDRLKKEHDQIDDYHQDKTFYPVPQLYGNDYFLGMWANAGNRYGSSNNRNNSFTPALVSELSEGPYGYQRILVTGAAPMPYNIHEEPQTQLYYSLKADYVHFSINYDPSRVLLGEERYKWKIDQLNQVDDRVTEIQHLAGGFDLGNWTIGAGFPSIQYAVRRESEFFTSRMIMTKFDASFRNRLFKTELFYGLALDAKRDDIIIEDDDSEEEKAEKERLKAELAEKPNFNTDLRVVRFNLDLYLFPTLKPRYSLLYRRLGFHLEEDGDGFGEFRYFSVSITNTLYLSYTVNKDLRMAGYFSAESHRKNHGVKTREFKTDNLYLKGGISALLRF